LVFSGAVCASAVGSFLGGLSAIIVQWRPWSLLMIALDIFVIWALAVRGREIAA
jgi:hypothetical protein